MSSFPSIRIEGGLLGPDLLDQVVAGELPGQKPTDFGLDSRRSLTDEIAAVFADARAYWGVFQNRLQRLPESDLATSVTRDAWMIPFFGLLGYGLHYNQRAYDIDGMSFAVSHRDGEAEDGPPIHIVGSRQELGRLSPSGRPRLAPHSLVQEYLNRTEHLWGVVTNGLTLRLLRDSTLIRRQAYVEFDLVGIMEEQRFQDFAALYRLLHRTRMPRGQADAGDCLLEKYYLHSVEQGGRVRDHLRDGVEECITRLANGFLSHPANGELRREIAEGRVTPEGLYRQLLRLIYRFLFLLVSEDRGLISPNSIYREHYGIARLRRTLDKRATYTGHDDLWQSLRLLWLLLQKDELGKILELAPLNGELFSPQTLDHCAITNRDLLGAFWHLTWYRHTPSAPPRRVNYAALDVEELGSVYESLLEFHPHVQTKASLPHFELEKSGGERRSTGSHYTPPELVAPLIKHALEPVMEERLKAAKNKDQRIRAILSLKVCDPACGSGHFLLAAARRLGKELARIRSEEDEPAPERVREAIRDVITHSIYGVDKNPLAVELCRVALWLESHEKGKPLTFLDHRIRCGDSLVGVFDLKVLAEGVPDEAFKPVSGDDKTIAREAKKRNAKERVAALFNYPVQHQLHEFAGQLKALGDRPETTIEQVREKAREFERLQKSEEYQNLKFGCDIWTSAFFQPFQAASGGPLTTHVLRAGMSHRTKLDARLTGRVQVSAFQKRFFHWPLEFPEVFEQGGFDVVIGNPPFLKGKGISTEFGDKYRNFLVIEFPPFPNTADLCAAFFRRGFACLRGTGCLGLIATNTIGQGDTREASLAAIVKDNGTITFGQRFIKWPGMASVEVNLVAVQQGQVPGPYLIDGQKSDAISSRLEGDVESESATLNACTGLCFIGDYPRGIGFVVEHEEAMDLLSRARNRQCLLPYLTGEDINTDLQQRPSRFAICFEDWSLERAQKYPELLTILEERVKPDRQQAKDALGRNSWWLFYRWRKDLRQRAQHLPRLLVRSRVSDLHLLAFEPNNMIFCDATVVFAFDDNYHFALLQSNIHEAWVRRNASTMRTDIRYTPTDCFETFAFPQTPTETARAEAERIGGEYHEHRRQTMLARQLGLTKTYNLFHNPECTDADITKLRELHAAMDHAILACYGWTDLDPGHGFHPNERGKIRYTIGPEARKEILRRLLALNLEVAAREAGKSKFTPAKKS